MTSSLFDCMPRVLARLQAHVLRVGHKLGIVLSLQDGLLAHVRGLNSAAEVGQMLL